MSFFGRNILLATAILVLPLSAHAATVFTSAISAGQFVSEAAVLRRGGLIEFRYNVLEDLNIQSFAVSATGNKSGIDVANIRFGFTNPGTNMFTTVLMTGTSSFGGGFLSGLTLTAGDQFSIFFNDGIRSKVALTLSFLTKMPSQVPLPAPAILLMAALAGLGAFAKRKAKRLAGPLAV